MWSKVTAALVGASYASAYYSGAGQCRVGAMQCSDDGGFLTCGAAASWVYRPCGPGTKCRMIGQDHPICDYPQGGAIGGGYGYTPYSDNQYMRYQKAASYGYEQPSYGSDREKYPSYGSGCIEGAMRCNAKGGFDTCNFGNWVGRDCGPGTTCQMIAANHPICNYAQSGSSSGYGKSYGEYKPYKPYEAPKQEYKPYEAPKQEYKPYEAPKQEYKPYEAPKQDYKPKQEYKPYEAPKQEYKPYEAPKQEYKPYEAPKQEYKPYEAPKQEYKPNEPTKSYGGFPPCSPGYKGGYTTNKDDCLRYGYENGKSCVDITSQSCKNNIVPYKPGEPAKDAYKPKDNYTPYGGQQQQQGSNNYGQQQQGYNAYGRQQQQGYNNYGQQQQGYNAYGGQQQQGYNAYGGQQQQAYGGQQQQAYGGQQQPAYGGQQQSYQPYRRQLAYY